MFNCLDLILKKRDGLVLTEEELTSFIKGVVEETIPNYQISAFLMAVYFQGLNNRETFYLTKAMIDQGETLNLDYLKGIKWDKHSSGGVGDKISLILIPTMAALGIIMPKMSGRGLGFSGGTIDKLESIPGFNCNLSKDAFKSQMEEIALGIIMQSGVVAPADKKLYALRDVTGTVENSALIAASIVSKKIASGNKNIIFDIKVGQGAFMKTYAEAMQLGTTMVEMVKELGGDSIAVLSNMNTPLGSCIGNSLEVMEAIDILKGTGSSDIVELVQILGGIILFKSNLAASRKIGEAMVLKSLADGSALEKIKEMIIYQGGNPKVLNNYQLFKQPLYSKEIKAQASGFIATVNALFIGEASSALGAGRREEGATIDLTAGIYLKKKTGDSVKAGDTLAIGYYSGSDVEIDRIEKLIAKAYTIDNVKPNKEKLVLDIIGM